LSVNQPEEICRHIVCAPYCTAVEGDPGRISWYSVF